MVCFLLKNFLIVRKGMKWYETIKELKEEEELEEEKEPEEEEELEEEEKEEEMKN